MQFPYIIKYGKLNFCQSYEGSTGRLLWKINRPITTQKKQDRGGCEQQKIAANDRNQKQDERMRRMKTKTRSWMKLVSCMLVVAFAIALFAPAGKGLIAYAEEPTAQATERTEEEKTEEEAQEEEKTEEQKAQEEEEAAKQERVQKWKKILIGGLVVGGVLIILAAAGNSGNTGSVKTSSATKTTLSGNGLIVVDNEACSIRITGIETSTLWGKGVAVKLENKSSDKNYMYSLESAAINGTQVTAFWAKEVKAGNNAYSTIDFYLSDEEAKQIGTYKKIDLSFRVYDWDNVSAPDAANVTVTYYPYGE
jgi:hypothetical protein